MKASAPAITLLAAGRFVSGVAAGCGAVVSPLIIVELAPPESKGKLYVIRIFLYKIPILTEG